MKLLYLSFYQWINKVGCKFRFPCTSDPWMRSHAEPYERQGQAGEELSFTAEGAAAAEHPGWKRAETKPAGSVEGGAMCQSGWGVAAWTWHLPRGIARCNLSSSQQGSRGQLRGLCQWLNSKKCLSPQLWDTQDMKNQWANTRSRQQTLLSDGTTNWKFFLGTPRIQQW